MAKNKSALRWLPLLTLFSVALTGAAQAEMYAFSIDQLKHTSSTLPGGAAPPPLSSSTMPEVPAAVPYSTLQMPALPKPTKVSVRPLAAPAASASGSLGTVPIVVSKTAPAAPKVINAATCRASLKYAAELALTTYQQKPDKSYMALVAAATLADDNVAAGFLPNMTAFADAAKALPWFFAPNRDALQHATQATELACTPPVSR